MRWTPDDRTARGAAPDAAPVSCALRYGENPHQEAALYSIVGADPAAGPFVTGAQPLQGKPLSYNNLLDASAVAAMARDLRGDAVVIVKHGNPCGAAEADDLVTRLGARARRRSGERLRRRRGRARHGRPARWQGS